MGYKEKFKSMQQKMSFVQSELVAAKKRIQQLEGQLKEAKNLMEEEEELNRKEQDNHEDQEETKNGNDAEEKENSSELPFFICF